MNSKDKSAANAFDFRRTFARMREHTTLLSAVRTGSKVRLTYPMVKRKEKTIYATLEDIAELPHYMGTPPPNDETCACLLCVFKHCRFKRGRN